MILNLQYVRAFAAMIVVLYHIVPSYPSALGSVSLYDLFYPWGAAGVDLFFVLSGFIMIYTQDKKYRNARRFIANRIIRIVPLYWAITCAWFLVLFLLSEHFRSNILDIKHLMASLAFISQPLGYDNPFVVPGWTLEYEAAFYVIFASSLLLFRRSYFYPILLVILLLAVFEVVPAIIVEFILGMIAAKFVKSGLLTEQAFPIFLIGACWFSLGAVIDTTNPDGSYNSDWHRVFFWGAPSFLIVWSLSNLPQYKARFLLFLGNSSYSLYLTHLIGIFIFQAMLDRLLVFPLNDTMALVLCLAFCVVFGGLSYLIFERPMTRWLRTQISASRGNGG